MILVLGGGFGLYGHLAAIARLGRPMATLARYRPIVQTRPEMASFAERIAWIDDEQEGCARASAVVLARRPADNFAIARDLIARDRGGTLVIEKPIAPTPGEALQLGDALAGSGRHCATPYLFLYCRWFDVMSDRFSNDAEAKLELHWSFRRSPHSGSWKSAGDEGGGALAFYFIQLIAIAERLLPNASREWSQTTDNDGETLILDSVDKGRRLSIRFDLDRAPMSFSVMDGTSVLARETTPFGAVPAAGTVDPRIPVLERFYREAVFGASETTNAHDRAVNEIWRDIDRDINVGQPLR